LAARIRLPFFNTIVSAPAGSAVIASVVANKEASLMYLARPISVF